MAAPSDEQDELLQKLRKLINASGEKEDTFGSEMADDARVWRVYAKAARKHDGELLAQWNGTLDTLLIFAGLFSAVSTTFIIDSYKQMQPDYAQETFRLLLANASGAQYVEPSDHVAESARAVNCLWISSLIASLSTALIAILAKQWLAFYPVSDRENLREWAQLRQYRFDSLELWHMPVLIAVVPVLLHVSLMLFLAGLVVFLWDIDTGTMVLAFVLSSATYGLYGFTTLSPVLWSSSPFRTPLTPVLQRTVHQSVNYTVGALSRFDRMAGRIACRFVSLFRDVLAAVAHHLGVGSSTPAMGTIRRLCHRAVHVVTRTVVTAGDPIYRLYCMAMRVARRCIDSIVGKVLAAVICPTSITLYSLAIFTILCFLAVHAVTRCISKVCSLAIHTTCQICRVCYTAVQSFKRKTLHSPSCGILARQRPSALPVDPWVTQTVFSDRVAAGALSWLGLSAETTDIYYAALYGLGDAVRGVTVADDLAPALKTRISVQTSDLISGRASSDLDVVITHLRAACYFPDLLPSRDVTAWVSDQVSQVDPFGKTTLRTPRDYDTLLRVSTILDERVAYKNLARFFGCPGGQEACESPSSILPSTARAIALIFIDGRNPPEVRTVMSGFQTNILPVLNALRSYLVASPDLAAELLKCSFTDEEQLIKDQGRLRGRPPHHCNRTSCEAMTYIVTILARHDFARPSWPIMSKVASSLKSKTFETFALFCRGFQPSDSCSNLQSNLRFWLLGETPFSQISLCGRDIGSFLHYCESLGESPDNSVHIIRKLLHPDQSWCAPDSSDPDRGAGLNACLDALARIYSDEPGLPKPRILLDEACLEPLSRAPDWIKSHFLVTYATDIASWSYVEDLVSKFLFCEVKGGPEPRCITRTWDLVVTGSQYILADAEGGYLSALQSLCPPLGKLRQRYPHKARWKEMGERVRQGAGFLDDPAWRARNRRNGDDIQRTIEEFCRIMDIEESDNRPESRSSLAGLEMNTSLLWAADEPESDGDAARKVLEWQIDGAY